MLRKLRKLLQTLANNFLKRNVNADVLKKRKIVWQIGGVYGQVNKSELLKKDGKKSR